MQECGEMVNYIFKLEFNYKDTIFFSIQNKERDVALIVFEDCCRKGELLKDFPFLCPQYYSSEEEWDDDRNLITASVYALIEEEYPPEMQDDIEYLVESMIEYKPAVNHKVHFLMIRRLENITVNEQKIECNLLIMYCPYVKIKRQYP